MITISDVTGTVTYKLWFLSQPSVNEETQTATRVATGDSRSKQSERASDDKAIEHQRCAALMEDLTEYSLLILTSALQACIRLDLF